MHEAYDALPEVTRQRIDGRLRATSIRAATAPESCLSSQERSARHRYRVRSPPLVRTHPESGRKAIYINPIRIEEIVGMETEEAMTLLDELLAHSMESRFEYRHKWRPATR